MFEVGDEVGEDFARSLKFVAEAAKNGSTAGVPNASSPNPCSSSQRSKPANKYACFFAGDAV
jgi:hypothetical protein